VGPSGVGRRVVIRGGAELHQVGTTVNRCPYVVGPSAAARKRRCSGKPGRRCRQGVNRPGRQVAVLTALPDPAAAGNVTVTAACLGGPTNAVNHPRSTAAVWHHTRPFHSMFAVAVCVVFRQGVPAGLLTLRTPVNATVATPNRGVKVSFIHRCGNVCNR